MSVVRCQSLKTGTPAYLESVMLSYRPVSAIRPVRHNYDTLKTVYYYYFAFDCCESTCIYLLIIYNVEKILCAHVWNVVFI